MRSSSSNIVFLGLLITMLAVIGVGCGPPAPAQGTVVQAYKEHRLYEPEVTFYVPDTLSSADSTRLADQYVEEWVRAQVVREAAEKAIPDLQDKVDFLLKDYERALIEQEYAAHLVRTNPEKLSVSLTEIKAYYEKYPEKFVSREFYYQYFYVSTKLPGQYRIINQIRSEDPDVIEELKKWAKYDAEAYKLDSTYLPEYELARISEGYYFGNIRKATINTPYAYQHEGPNRTYFDFFRLLSVIEPGEQMPLSMCRERIGQILRNQRIQAFVDQHIQELVDQARAAQQVSDQGGE